MAIASIVIPANDEAAIIGNCLTNILSDARPGEFEIIVAANGCLDGTANVAATFPDVTVIELATASKPAALNFADETATTWPRLYVDADVTVSTNALRATVRLLNRRHVLAAAPSFNVNTQGRPWAVRAYYDIYRQIPWTQDGMIGSGFYALSKRGHDRLGAFPDVVGEDLLVARLFAPNERATVPGVRFTIQAPHDLRTLLRVKTRVATGNLTLRRKPVAGLVRRDGPRNRSVYRHIAKRPTQWPALAAYAAVYIATRVGAVRRYRKGDLTSWTRDQSTRSAPPP